MCPSLRLTREKLFVAGAHLELKACNACWLAEEGTRHHSEKIRDNWFTSDETFIHGVTSLPVASAWKVALHTTSTTTCCSRLVSH